MKKFRIREFADGHFEVQEKAFIFWWSVEVDPWFDVPCRYRTLEEAEKVIRKAKNLIEWQRNSNTVINTRKYPPNQV